MNTILNFLLLMALVTLASASSRYQRDEMTGHIASTREEILARRERRKDHFGEKFEEYKQQLDDHHSGRRLLAGGDLNYIQKKVKAYETKLKQLHKEIDDRVRPSSKR